MVQADGLLRIFWPSDLPRNKSQGTIIGWRNAALDVFVVAMLQDVEVRLLHNYTFKGSLMQLRRGRLKALFVSALFCETARTLCGRYMICVEMALCMS